MVTRRQILAGAGALAVAGASTAMTSPSTGLASDIRILRRAYQTMHPGLYRYATPAQMNRWFDELEAIWAKAPTQRELYLSLSRFLARVKCGHSYANFYNQKKDVAAALFSGPDKLPFHFRWIDGRMIVTANGGDALPRGSEILTIDGKPVKQILASLQPYARADGSNDAKRIAQLEVQGFDRFEAFDIFFALERNRPGTPFDLVTSRGPMRVDPIDLTARRAQMPARASDDNAPMWTLELDGAGSARLIMPDWSTYDTKWDWRRFLDDSFEQIASRNVQALIVDLRGNEGGEDCGDEIIARCIDAPLQRASYERRVKYRKAPADLDQYLDTWDPSFKDWGNDAEPLGNGFYRLIEKDGASRAPITPKGPRYRGKLIVLVDATNSSATFQFANTVQANKLGVLVGSPTGGNLRGINGGAFFFLRLPASGLEADLPVIGTFPATPQPDRGLTPDIEVSDTIDDVTNGRDAVLSRARAFARG
jgi:C-terminal processing protease CtpA/Prc